MRPAKPSSRSVSAALAPARAAPTITKLPSSGVITLALLVSRTATGPSWSSPCQAEELGPRPRIVAHQALECRGHRLGSVGAHAAQRHAQVFGLEHDTHTLGLQGVRNEGGHLGR